jgi:hypothetical protein
MNAANILTDDPESHDADADEKVEDCEKDRKSTRLNSSH